MDERLRVSTSQAEKLGHYVYVFYDKATGDPFYIGKGYGERVLSHVRGSHNPAVRERVAEGDCDFDFLAYGLDDETAMKVEAAAIDLVGIERLLNATRGKGASRYGRVNARLLLGRLENEPLSTIQHDVLVVSIKNTYERYGDDEEAMYESTRGIWALSEENACNVDYVFGVVDGRIVYVMSIAAVLPAGSTNYFVRESDMIDSNRIEFVGRTASEDIRELYLGRALKANQQPTYYGPNAGRVHLVDDVWKP